MIDWVTAILPCDHDPLKLDGGKVFSMLPDGTIEWHVVKAKEVEGSHSSKITIKTNTDKTIWVSGNPAKFLQGHNIFGTDDLVYLMGRFFDALLKRDELGLSPTSDQYDFIQSGSYRLTRVDYNLSWHLENKEAVLSWIRAAANCANLKYRGAGQFTGDTLYFGKHSRFWSLKCYSKGHEITAKNHAIPKALQHPDLMLWANKALRLELVFRSMFLKSMMLDVAQNWTKDTGKELLLSCIRDDLQISDNMAIKDDVIQSLPSKLRLVYSAWSHGTDIRTIYSKAQFYKYRKQLLAYGIDISVIHDSNRSNVIPLVRYLEAVPASIPDWAYEKGLVA